MNKDFVPALAYKHYKEKASEIRRKRYLLALHIEQERKMVQELSMITSELERIMQQNNHDLDMEELVNTPAEYYE